jgi:hypothetical protein
MTHEEHNALHRAERTKRATKTKKCATCNEEFAFLPRGRRTGKSAPKYCTATCYYISKR